MINFIQKKDSNQNKFQQKSNNDLSESEINNPFLSPENKGTNPFLSSENKSTNPFINPAQSKENPFLNTDIANTNPFLDISTQITSKDSKTESNMIIQQKIEENKLNIVGEFHPESDKRGRNHEKQFVQERYGLKKYWQEYEFATDLEGEKTFGDDPLLNLAHAATFALQFIDILKNDFGNNNDLKNFESVEEQFIEICLGIEHYADHIDQWFIELKDDFLGSELLIDVKKSLISINDAKNLDDNEFNTFFDNLELLENFAKTLIAKLVPNKKNQPLDELDEDLTKDRSKEMFRVAMLASSDKNNIGVWKVGNRHIEDMIPFMETYEIEHLAITPESEFTPEFNDWNKSKKQESGNSNN